MRRSSFAVELLAPAFAELLPAVALDAPPELAPLELVMPELLPPRPALPALAPPSPSWPTSPRFVLPELASPEFESAPARATSPSESPAASGDRALCALEHAHTAEAAKTTARSPNQGLLDRTIGHPERLSSNPGVRAGRPSPSIGQFSHRAGVAHCAGIEYKLRRCME